MALLMTDEFRDYTDKIGDRYKNVHKSYDTFITNIHLIRVNTQYEIIRDFETYNRC